MDAILIYFLKASGILAIFWGIYHLFLKKETFFEANRHFLLAGILAAFAFPFLEITRYVTVENTSLPNFSGIPIAQKSQVAAEAFPWETIILGIYGIGVLFLLIKFLVQLFSLRKLIVKHEVKSYGTYKLVETNQDLAPFSFFNYIFYNPGQFTQDELEAIRHHEEAHCAQKHSIDVMCAHLLTIALWMNPLSWLYRKNIQQNLEFLADFSAVNRTQSIKNYQYALLKVSSNPIQTPITNNFYNSLIKKRIVMLHKSKSNQLQALKFAIILPLLAGFIFTFNTKVVAQEKEKDVKVEFKIERIEIVIDKGYTNEQINSDTKFMKERGIDLKFKGVKRNTSGEITSIKATYKTETGKSGSYSLNGDEPIEPFSFRVSGEGEERSIGFFSVASLHKSHTMGNTFIVEVDDDELHEGEHTKKKVIRLHTADDDAHTWVEKGEGEEMKVLVKIEDGEKVITINGEEVTEEELEEFSEQADGKRIKIKKMKKGKGGNVFIIKDSDSDSDFDYDVEFNDKKGGAFFIMDSDKDGDPLFIVDGKEMDRKEFKNYH